MKFLHTSDWHLGLSFRGGISYASDQEFAINGICRIAAEEKVDGILLSGDVFDKSVAPGEALLLYDKIMTRICLDLGIPVFIIAGNHDGAERISQCSELLKKSGLHIAGSLTKTPNIVNTGDTDIYLLPWISTDKVRAVYPEKADDISSMEDAYKVVLDHYRSTFTEGRTHILMSHAFIVNAETSVSDRAAEVGRATMVGSFVFDGFDYVALGHLHAPQSINERIRYSGSPMAYSFGKEESQEKSVTIFDTDSRDVKVVPLPHLHKRATLTGTFDELLNGPFDEEILKGYVKLEVTDSYVGMESLAALRERYVNLLEVTGRSFEKEDERITLTREEFENVSSDPEEIFKRYCRDIMDTEPGIRLSSLFNEALKEYEKKVVLE